MSEDGRRENRTFFRLWNWTIIVVSGLIILAFSILTAVNLIHLGWGIFFISYFIGILLFDYILASDVLILRKKWKNWFRYCWPRSFVDNIKDDITRHYWRDYHKKRMIIYILIFLFIVLFIFWGFFGAGNIPMAIMASVVLISALVYGMSRIRPSQAPRGTTYYQRSLWDGKERWERWYESRRYEILKRKKERKEKHTDRKKHDLTRYKQTHPKH